MSVEVRLCNAKYQKVEALLDSDSAKVQSSRKTLAIVAVATYQHFVTDTEV
jgi:hypothetical protein